MALRGGLRKGELIAIQWGDIQFGTSEEDPNRYIMVQHNCVYGIFTTPKSKKSRRVDLSRELRRALLQLRDKRMLEAFMNGKTSILDELVFPSKTGTALDPSNLFHYHFLPCLEHAGLRRFRFHDLRHTFGSLLIQDGASLAYVKDQMGHSSIQIAVNITATWSPEQKEQISIGWMGWIGKHLRNKMQPRRNWRRRKATRLICGLRN